MTVAPIGVSPELAGAKGMVRVRVLLRRQPVLEKARRPAFARVLQGRASSGTPAANDRRRTEALGRVGELGREAVESQAALVDAIERVGGRVVLRSPAPNSVVAVVPAAALDELARFSDVQTIDRAPVEKPLLNIAASASGADTWWTDGGQVPAGNAHTGGRGSLDTSLADLAIRESIGVNEASPAFAGVAFLRPRPDCNALDNHGTPVTGMAVSQDSAYRGLAYGADKLLNACSGDGSTSADAWAAGIDQPGLAGAGDPAEVLNYSYGSNMKVGQDDTGTLQSTDYFTSAFGITYVAPAGNEHDDVIAPDEVEINSPSTSYNAISVAASNDVGTDGFGDDIATDYSSRGPTPGGRKKPDIAAMGGCGGGRCLTLPQGNPSPTFLGGYGGTSFASPHVAAGALLLAGAGVSDSKAQKALLINSAYPYAGQTTWRNDSGWGIMDLDRAYAELNFLASSTVEGQSAKFYSASIASGDKATLTWQRRAICAPWPGYTGFPKCTVTAYTFSNLDLVQYDAFTQAEQQISSSDKDSVEQVRSATAGNAIYKVDAVSSVDGAASEPYAIAASHPLVALDAPTVSQTPSIEMTQARPGQDVTVEVAVQNTGDLEESAAQVTLSSPVGIQIVSGSANQTVGGASLGPGEQATASWTVEGAQDDSYSLPVTASSTGWGESFQSQSTQQLKIDSTAPSASVSDLDTYTTDGSIELSWSGEDGAGAGVASYDVQVRDTGGAWQNLLTETSSTSTTYQGTDGHTYEFRARATDALGNAGAYPDAAQAKTTVDTQGPSLTVSGPTSVKVGETATYSVSASDAASGIASLAWQIEGSLPATIAGSTFTVPGGLTSSAGMKTVTVSATDGAGRASTGQVGLAVVSPGEGQKLAAKLEVARARANGRKVAVRGTIAGDATGHVRLARVRQKTGSAKARRAPTVKRWTKRRGAISGGRWSVAAVLSRGGRYELTVTYAGDARHGRDRALVSATLR